MQKIEMYTTNFCPYCARAKMLLQKKNVLFTEYAINSNPSLRKEMMARSKSHTVPQIFIANQSIGGCDELQALKHSGQLDKILSQ